MRGGGCHGKHFTAPCRGLKHLALTWATPVSSAAFLWEPRPEQTTEERRWTFTKVLLSQPFQSSSFHKCHKLLTVRDQQFLINAEGPSPTIFRFALWMSRWPQRMTRAVGWNLPSTACCPGDVLSASLTWTQPLWSRYHFHLLHTRIQMSSSTVQYCQASMYGL